MGTQKACRSRLRSYSEGTRAHSDPDSAVPKPSLLAIGYAPSHRKAPPYATITVVQGHLLFSWQETSKERSSLTRERVSLFHILGRGVRWLLNLPKVHRAAAEPSLKHRRASQVVSFVSLATCVMAMALMRFQSLLVWNRQLTIERSNKFFRSSNGYDLYA